MSCLFCTLTFNHITSLLTILYSGHPVTHFKKPSICFEFILPPIFRVFRNRKGLFCYVSAIIVPRFSKVLQKLLLCFLVFTFAVRSYFLDNYRLHKIFLFNVVINRWQKTFVVFLAYKLLELDWFYHLMDKCF